jgi:hypothetical protein
MDYEALARQFGGQSAAPPAGGMDYESLARQYGGASTAAPSPFASAVPQLDAQGQIIRQPAPLPSTEPSRGVMDVIAGVPEAALTLGSGAVAGTVAPFVAVGEEILSGQYGRGTPETERRAAELAQRFTYQPVSRTGQQIVGTVGEAVEGLGLEAIPVSQGLTAAAMGPSAARQATQIAGREAKLVAEAARSIPAVRQAQEARVAQSFVRAPQIEAANLAQQYGIALDPAASNPSLRTRARVAAVGETELEQKLAAQNAPAWTAEAKKALDLPPTVTLNDDAFKTLKNAPDITEPYAVVRNTPRFVADQATISKLDEARSPQLVADIDGKVVAKLNKKLDGIKERIASGVEGKALLDSIQDFRSQAASIYAKGKPTKPLKTGDRNLVKIYDAAADALEEMIDTNLSGKALSDYRAARARYAQINSLEAATNKVTGVVDPLKLAKQLEDGRPLSGPVADLGRIASTFPNIAKVDVAAKTTIPRFARASAGGTIGGLVGGLVGGPMGVPVGIATGAGISEVARRIALNQMGTPGYQRSRAMPPDFRPQTPVNALRPVEPGQSNIVPFDPRMAVMEPEAPGPNFTFGRPDADVRAGMQAGGPAQLPAPSAEGTLASLRAEDARRAAMSRQMGGAQEAQMAAAEAATPRQSAGSGMVLDLDPITGQLRPASQAAPAFQTPGSSLSSAADKLSRGQRFALTADEMVAWNKTSVELAELMPGMKTLSQKAIAEKMMDRKWVESALKKAVEKEEAFKLIERQSKDMQMVQQARIARESLMDAVETLQEALSRPRAKEAARTKGQGPKTRAAKNQLGQIETLNKLID